MDTHKHRTMLVPDFDNPLGQSHPLGRRYDS
jgi:hypothetical protein